MSDFFESAEIKGGQPKCKLKRMTPREKMSAVVLEKP